MKSKRPLPQVYRTTEFDSVRWKEEPITVRIYSDERNATIVKLSVREAKALVASLTDHLSRNTTR